MIIKISAYFLKFFNITYKNNLEHVQKQFSLYIYINA